MSVSQARKGITASLLQHRGHRKDLALASALQIHKPPGINSGSKEERRQKQKKKKKKKKKRDKKQEKG